MPDYIIAVDRDQTSDTDTAEDVVQITADGFDSPVTAVNDIGDSKAFDLVNSYVEDYPDYTPRMVVGLFGSRGLYRVVGADDGDGPDDEGAADVDK